VKFRFARSCGDRLIAKAANAINRLISVISIKELHPISDLAAFRSEKQLGNN
jgi:hypothetical protein